MPTMYDHAFALWTWPIQAGRLASDIVETMLGAQRVIGARMPTLRHATLYPFAADHVELGRMFSEKVGAFGLSGQSVASAGAVVRRASAMNGRALGRLVGGDPLWPSDWMQMAEHSLAAAAALAALPAAALSPIRDGVMANDKRLGR